MMQVGRIKYERPSNYCSKVYIGNWYEDRCSYQKTRLPIISTYQIEFCPKPHSAVDPNVMWKTKIEHEGFGPRLMTDHGTGEFLDNLTTLNDLSYNHYPKCVGGPIHRKLRHKIPKYIPEDDYLPSFGNLTKYGILEAKKEQWKCDKAIVRRTGSTNYRDAYVAPDLSAYRRNSVNIDDRTDQQQQQFKVCHTMKSKQLRCNPITWECPPYAVRS